jgi:two-component system, OmpR family, response regulator
LKVLVAEDVSKVSASIAAALKASGYICDIAEDGEDAWFKGSTENYSVIILDLGLPKMDGLTVLKKWREENNTVPVLILSARGTWTERVEGIDSGADDYLPKPFEMGELLSRVRALVRRQSGQASSSIVIGPLTVNVKLGSASVDGVPLNLTPLEFRLVHYLANNRGRVVPQSELADNLYAHDHDRDANAVEAAVSRVRRKIGKDILQNKRGFGYFLDAG